VIRPTLNRLSRAELVRLVGAHQATRAPWLVVPYPATESTARCTALEVLYRQGYAAREVRSGVAMHRATPEGFALLGARAPEWVRAARGAATGGYRAG
jgi:hypothetical protein